jgi:HD-GYP domain-containing protein (c-di-GMP phosphodiesterase class II)
MGGNGPKGRGEEDGPSDVAEGETFAEEERSVEDEATQRYAAATKLMFADRPDAQAHGHGTARVAIRAAIGLGFSNYVAGRIGLAAILHDIGKQLISKEILDKPGPLDPEEWAQVRLHPILGAQILLGEGLTDIAPWVRSHHERVDGLGYPDGLAGDLIPLEARVIAVADAYDAMITDRCYQQAVTPREAREELILGAGTQFDSRVLSVVLRCIENDAEPAGMEAAPVPPA